MGFIGWILVLWGNFFIGRKHNIGFLFSIAAEFFIGWNAWETSNPSLFAAVVVFLAFNIYNYVRWLRHPPVRETGVQVSEVVMLASGMAVLGIGWFFFGATDP